MTTLKKGSKGEEVKRLQQLLGVTVDGDFGPATEKAVIAFQKAHNLDADGIVGEKTWTALGVKSDKKSSKDIHIIMNYGHSFLTPGKRSPKYSTLSKEEQEYFKKYSQFGADRYYEYLSNRVIGKQITASLREKGWTVHEIEQKAANGLKEINAATKKLVSTYGKDKCVFVSIHSNAAAAKDNGWAIAKGWSAYTTKGKDKSDKLATYLYKYAELEFKGRTIRKDMKDGDPDKEENFSVIYNAHCPAVLTESFFYNDKDDLKYLVSEKGQRAIVRVHVNGIEEFILKEML